MTNFGQSPQARNLLNARISRIPLRIADIDSAHMQKILLVNPPAFIEETYSRYAMGAPELPPLGLAYVASMVRQDHDVRILDCVARRMGLRQFCEEVRRWSPDIVAFTSTTISYLKAVRCMEEVKRIDPGIVTVLGGVHINAAAEQTMGENAGKLDFGVIGEGEHTFKSLVDAIDRERPSDSISGTAYYRDNSPRFNAPSPQIATVDTLPFPSRDLFGDPSQYAQTVTRSTKGKGLSLNAITSRGCPYSCTYCDQWMFGRKWRAHSPDYVLREVDHLVNDFNVRHISFEDDTFTIIKKRTLEICRLLEERKYDLSFNICARVETLDDETLSWLKRAGCFTIFMGIESGDPEMLDFIHRPSREAVSKGVKRIRSHGIKVYGSFILGFPKETRQSARNTIEFAKSLDVDSVSFNVFTPYPMTELARIAPEHGEFLSDWKYYSDHAPRRPFVPHTWTEKELLELQRQAYKEFYMRPKTILANLSRLREPRFLVNGLAALKMFYFDTIQVEGIGADAC